MRSRKPKLPRYVQRIGAKFRARIERAGRQHVSPRFNDPESAAAWAAEFLELEQMARAPAGIPTLGDAWRLVVKACADRRAGTLEHYRSHWRTVERAWPPETGLHQITGESLQAFVDMRRGDGVSGSTIAKEVGLIRRMYRLAMRARLAKDDPTRYVSMPRVEQQPYHALPMERVGRILAFLREQGQDDHADIVQILALTGLRRTELARLDVAADADFVTRRLWVRGKRGGRYLTIGPDLEAVLRSFRGAEPWRVGRAFTSTRKQLVAAGLLAPGEQWSPHVMRHSFATALVGAGVGLADAQRLMGHSTPAMTARYYAGQDEAARTALAAVANALRASPLVVLRQTR
jgi:site-specific recombinase XerD